MKTRMASMTLGAVLCLFLMTVDAHSQQTQSVAKAAQTPEKTSLNFKNMNIIEVFRALSESSDFNIVASSGVKGNVTLFLADVTAREAFDIVVNLNNLAYVQDGKTIMVFTEQEYQSLYNRKFRDQPVMRAFSFTHVSVG
jgi:type II secretory pathway component HofQ